MKALIAMSGGVDSSVSALLMKQQGYECIGCTMKLFDKDDLGLEQESSCCSLSDVEDARSVAHRLDMKYYVFNFCDGFKEQVIGKFADSYIEGRTPNPCIDCNRYMKFEKLYLRAKELGCDKIVTGHYARIEEKNGKWYLLKGIDESKDQSYVLYNMTQELLAHTCFPLGGMPKEEARRIAEENDFINARKKDSQDICFAPDGDYAKVISKIKDLKSVPGEFRLKDGTTLGEHKGIIHYTIGQRKGLGIAYKEPLYVVKIDVPNNVVVLGSNDDLFSRELKATDVNWISGEVEIGKEMRVTARVRYHAKEEPATLRFVSDTEFELRFDEPQRAITPGQAVVVYDGEIVLGGGTIV